MRQQLHITRLLYAGKQKVKIPRYIGEPYKFIEEELVNFLKLNGLVERETHYVDAGTHYHDYHLAQKVEQP